MMDVEELESQLQNVTALLQQDPYNAAYLELEKTLQEALEVARLNKEEVVEEAQEVVQASNSVQEDAQDTTSSELADLTGKKRRRDEELAKILVGARCEVLISATGVWVGATLEDYENVNGFAKVCCLFDGQARLIRPEGIREIKPCGGRKIDPTELKIGMKCKARYSGDGRLYDGSILQITRNGCMIRFDKYNNEEEVAFEHLKNVVAVGGTEQNVGTAVDQIPEHLKIEENDSDKIKEQKKKTLQKLKKQTKEAQKDLIQDKKRQGWQAFQAKRKKKR